MKKLFIINLICLFFFSGPVLAQNKKKEKSKDLSYGYQTTESYQQMDERYKNWLHMVTYIASKEEKNIFLKLSTRADREMFIKIFWQQRDLSKGTEINEYKLEIERRFRHVNKFFSRGTPRPGWMTDMGRIYMILGKPNSIETVDNKVNLHPAQIWYYYGSPKLGLPTYFHITFFRRHGVGEWVIYDPIGDGPASLFVSGNLVDTSNYKLLYEKIKSLAPKLAIPSLSMIPNQVPYAYQPSLQNNQIMANIYHSPLKTINTSYATNFLKYKGFVNIDSSVDFVKSSTIISINHSNRYPYPLINFSIKPQKISVNFDNHRNKYYFNFHMVVSLKQQKHTVYEYSKNFDYYFNEDQLDVLKSGGVILQDHFPALPGNYQMKIFIQNKAGKEFSFHDQEIKIPAQQSPPYLAAPLLAYKMEKESSTFLFPYQFNNQKLSIDPGKNFSAKDVPLFLLGIYNLDQQTWERGSLEWQLEGLNERNKYNKKGKILLHQHPFQTHMHIIQKIPELQLKSDYYQLTFRLLDAAGILMDTRSANFMISPLSDLAKPTEMYSKIQANNFSFFDYIIGVQNQHIGDYQKAEQFLSRSTIKNPYFIQGLMAYLDVELKLKKYQQVLEIVERIKKDPNRSFLYHRIKGEALYGLKQYQSALTEFLAANKIYNSDIKLINIIGMTFIKLNNKPKALEAFQASLKLNGNQPLIRKAIEDLNNTKEEIK